MIENTHTRKGPDWPTNEWFKIKTNFLNHHMQSLKKMFNIVTKKMLLQLRVSHIYRPAFSLNYSSQLIISWKVGNSEIKEACDLAGSQDLMRTLYSAPKKRDYYWTYWDTFLVIQTYKINLHVQCTVNNMAWPTMPSITWENAALDLPSIDGEDIIIILLLNVGVYWHMDHGRLSCMSYMSKVGLNRSSAHFSMPLELRILALKIIP